MTVGGPYILPMFFHIILYTGHVLADHSNSDKDEAQVGSRSFKVNSIQWRRHDLLRGAAKLETMSWGTHGEVRAGCSS